MSSPLLLPPITGEALHALASELFPFCRSITGEGVRQTLDRIGREIPIRRERVASDTPVFDWRVPPEWNLRDAWIQAPDGRRVVDLVDSSLHVVSYSTPVRKRLSLAELRPHLHTLPDRPDLIPYRTSYYAPTWGFCLRHRDLERLREGEYEVCIDSTLAPGHLDYAELVIPGERDDEMLFSCHICHPSLANDNLSAIAVAAGLARVLLDGPRRRLTYRFLFIPGTIGAITWLARNRDVLARVRHGLVLACLGDPGDFTYKRSRRDRAEIDLAVESTLLGLGHAVESRPFTPYGYDERQFCSPGIDLSVGRLTRTPNGEYPEYHTSGDDLDLMRPSALAESLAVLQAVVERLEDDLRYRNTQPHCEPQLGRRGLYRALGGTPDPGERSLAMLWLLNYSDGEHSVRDIGERAGLPLSLVRETAELLEKHGLLERVGA